MAHLTVEVLAMRTHSHFGGPPAHYETWEYAGTADDALAQLDATYDAWAAGVTVARRRRGSPARAARPRVRSRRTRWPLWSSTSTAS